MELEEKFSNWGDFTSCFFEGPLDINYEPVSGEPDWAMSEQYWPMLKHFLCSGSIQGVDDWIEDISLSEAKKFYKLNLHQFEGSLITNLLWGGCYGSPCETREQARKISSVLIDELYPNINSAPLIFSLVSEDWTGHWAKLVVFAIWIKFMMPNKTINTRPASWAGLVTLAGYGRR